jgi:hypothetical protein
MKATSIPKYGNFFVDSITEYGNFFVDSKSVFGIIPWRDLTVYA